MKFRRFLSPKQGLKRSKLKLRLAEFVVLSVLEITRIQPGDWVLIMGPGPMGLLALQLAKVSGGRVAICGITSDGERLALAGDLGADLTINVEKEDVAAIIRELTGGYGPDPSFLKFFLSPNGKWLSRSIRSTRE